MSKSRSENRTRRNFLTNSIAAAGASAIFGSTALAVPSRACLSGDSNAADYIINNLRKLENIYGGFPINQLQHALQAASLAKNDNQSDEVIVAVLCHDIGKVISNFNHEEMGAEILKPYVSDNVYNMMKFHGVFQGRFFWDKIFRNHELYLRFKNAPWYNLAMVFTEKYDKPAFKTSPAPGSVHDLEFFIPIIRRVVVSR